MPEIIISAEWSAGSMSLSAAAAVSRQSVSKWEGAQAVPDMKKIVQMSDLFGVSTDYLLRDEIETVTPPEAVPVDSGLGEDLVRSVSMEEANAFLVHNEKAASRVSTGVMLCILSPVIMIVMTGLAGAEKIPMDETFAGIGGLVVLLIMVAAAVGLFLKTMMSGKPFEYLENTNIDTEYGVSGMVRERCSDYAETHSRLLIIGIMLCVISAIPLVIMELAGYSNNTDVLPVVGVAALLVTVAIGVKMIVLTCIRQGGFDKLLEEGDYTRLSKKAGRYDGIYWAIALAVYLGWSFINNGWQYTWIVWPIAGVLHAAYKEIMKAVARKR